LFKNVLDRHLNIPMVEIPIVVLVGVLVPIRQIFKRDIRFFDHSIVTNVHVRIFKFTANVIKRGSLPDWKGESHLDHLEIIHSVCLVDFGLLRLWHLLEIHCVPLLVYLTKSPHPRQGMERSPRQYPLCAEPRGFPTGLPVLHTHYLITGYLTSGQVVS